MEPTTIFLVFMAVSVLCGPAPIAISLSLQFYPSVSLTVSLISTINTVTPIVLATATLI